MKILTAVLILLALIPAALLCQQKRIPQPAAQGTNTQTADISDADLAGTGESPEQRRTTGGIPQAMRVLVGTIQLVISAALGLFIVYFSYWIFLQLVRDIREEDELKKKNVSVGILMSSFIFGIMILLKRSLYPIFSILKDLFLNPKATFGLFMETLFFSIAYLALSLTIAVLIGVASLRLFDVLTKKIREFEEIRKNNLAVAVLFAGIFLSLCFFIEEGLHALLITLIPGMQINIL